MGEPNNKLYKFEKKYLLHVHIKIVILSKKYFGHKFNDSLLGASDGNIILIINTANKYLLCMWVPITS